MRVLAIIDVQMGFVNDATSHIPDTVQSLQNPFDLVFATKFENPPDSPFRQFLGLQRFGGGMPETELAFAPRKDARIFVKHAYSAATDELKRAGREAGAVHLCGIATDNCVLATAVDLFDAGLRPVVIADCCASHAGPRYHEAALMILKRLIGEDQVVTRAALGL